MGFRSTALRLNLDNEAARAGRQGGAGCTEEALRPTGENTKSSARPTRFRRGWTQAIAAGASVALHIQTDGNPRPWQAAFLGVAIRTVEAGRAAYLPLPTAELTEPRLPLADAAARCHGVADRSIGFEDRGERQTCRAGVAPGRIAGALAGQRSVPRGLRATAGAHDHGLADLAPLHLGHTPKTLDETTGTGRNRLSFAQVPVAAATAYAAEQADARLAPARAALSALRNNGALALYEQVERRLIPVLSEMERAGIRVDAGRIAPHVRRFRRAHGGDGNRCA